MKKLLLFIVALLGLSMLTAKAQFSDATPITLKKHGSTIVAMQYGMETMTPLNQILDSKDFARYRSGKGMVTWGIVSTVVGGLLTVGGVAGAIANTVELSDAKVNRPPEDWGHYQKGITTGYVLTGIGAAGLAGGIALITLGHSKINKIVVNHNLAVTQNGVGLTMAF